MSSQSAVQKIRSRRTKVGEARSLDQVNFLPERGSSFRSKSLSSRLNLPIIALSRLSLLLSSALYIRLKSPPIIHGPRHCDRIRRSSLRN
ncbi:hypothetical protein ZEAMMB73_Zm00001d036723 [Zea mays]|uniref:Uncharacterized protein n=1 Tax=Zea mays TaxID=4577 RepID=A0A1D6LQL4_MAIZE|nr:hypothetical protein ZEAMMB73_Zm00001d036723 [Zea mays]